MPKKGKRKKAKADPTPSAVLLAARLATGAGFHGKSRKAERQADKQRLKKGDYE